ncbi:MAG: hypothetical protein IJX02_06630 [Clostridia bacterium]|nr:hypothetical protein [Clostridia bacterium]
MGEGFKRLKKGYLIDALVKSLLVFLSAALLVVATFLIVIRQSEFDIEIYACVLIGIAFGLLLGLTTFLILNPRDKRLAKRLDKKYGLGEKVQTMYAFRNDEGGMKKLQREDTVAILNGKAMEWKEAIKAWAIFISAFLVCLAYFVTSLVLLVTKPEAEKPGGDDGEIVTPTPTPPPEEEFEPTDHQRKALEELIVYVNESKLQDDAKVAVVGELTILLARLDELGTDTQMRDFVVGVIKNVRGIVNTVNTTFAFHVKAGNSKDENLKNLSYALYSLDLNAISAQLEALNTTLYTGGDKISLTSFGSELAAVLESEAFKNKGALYDAFVKLNTVLTDVINNDYSQANIMRKLNNALMVDALNSFNQIIPQQKTNEEVKTYTVSELMRIFGISAEDVADRKDENGSVETEEPEERPEYGDDGGFGTGDTIFGSNDVVIDPSKDPQGNIDSIYAEYGDIIYKNGYSQKINDMLINGELSDELKEILRKYFEILETPSDN